MRLINSAVVLATLLVTASAMAQSGPIAPPNLNRYVSASSLSQADLASIKAYVDREAPRLASDVPADAVQARTKLVGELQSRTRRVSPLFREQYTALLEPHLRALMAGDNLSAAVMAAQVAGTLGTDGAVKMLTDRIDPKDEPRMAVRVWAAGGVGALTAMPTVSERRTTRALRSLAIACCEEPDWAVRRRMILSMANAMANQRGQDASQHAVRDAAIEQLAQAMADTLQDIASGQAQFVQTLPIATTELQSTLLTAGDDDTRTAIAEVVVPVLARGHDAILQSWDSIRQDPRSLAAAARFLDESELLLTILTQSDPTDAQLSKAVLDGNRRPVETAARRWAAHRG